MVKRNKGRIKSKSKVVSKSKKKPDRLKQLPAMPLKEVYSQDPNWQWIQNNIKTMDQARYHARQHGIPIRRQRVPQYKRQIYRAMLEDVEVKKAVDVNKVELQLLPDKSVIVVQDRLANRDVILIDVNPNPVIEVEVDDLGTILAIKGKSPSGASQETLLEILPEIGEELEKEEVKPIAPPVVLKKGKTWKKKPINKPDPEFLAKDRSKLTIKEITEKEQIKIYNDYLAKGFIPFYASTGKSVRKDLRPFSIFSDAEVIEEAEWIGESADKMKVLIDKGIVEKSADRKPRFKTLSGNQIQTKVNYDNGKFSGLYYQNSKKLDPKTKEKGELPTCIKADFMRVDPDPIGMFQAWFLLEYVNPEMKLIDENGAEQPLDYLLAMRALSGSIIDTKAMRRNIIVRDTIKDVFGKSSLVWLPKGGRPKDLSLSDQMIRACGLIATREVDMEVKTPDFTITFSDFKIRDFQEASPKLSFNPKIDPIVEPLDSDTLLQIAMQKLKMEAIVIQNLLEALYQQNWISYPRASITKADKEPIRIKNPSTGKIYGKGEGREAEALVNNPDFKIGFKGTLHEKQLMDLIVKSQVAQDQNKPFIMYGEWNLISGSLVEKSKRKNYVHIVGDPLVYTADQIDIDMGERGIREDDLVAQLIEEDVATPSTRTAMLEELKNAGILSRRAERLVVDRRGLYMASLDDYYINNNFERAYQLKNILAEATVEEMADLVTGFDWIAKDSARYDEIKSYIETKANEMIEAEQDLAYLEREGMPEQIE